MSIPNELLLEILCEETDSVLFGTAGAKKNIFRSAKLNAVYRVSRLRARQGLRALDLRKLLKKFDQNFQSVLSVW